MNHSFNRFQRQTDVRLITRYPVFGARSIRLVRVLTWIYDRCHACNTSMLEVVAIPGSS